MFSTLRPRTDILGIALLVIAWQVWHFGRRYSKRYVVASIVTAILGILILAIAMLAPTSWLSLT